MDSESKPLHIVVFPWLAFGHMLPFLELSKSLAQRGHFISFIATPRNIQRLPKLPPDLSSLIQFISLPLPPTQGLPDSAEATSDIPPQTQEYLKLAFDGLQQPLSKFIQESDPKPDWIVHDFAPYWLPSIAKTYNIPTVFLTFFNAANLAFLGPPSELDCRGGALRKTPEDFTVQPSWFHRPSTKRWLLYEARAVLDFFFKPNVSGVSDSYRIAVAIESSNAVSLRTCYEFEPDWLELLQKLYGKDIIPIGLFPPRRPPSSTDQENSHVTEGDKEIMDWLEERNPRSVIYVAFGSEVMLSDELMQEIALGLEQSKVPFIWALRKTTCAADPLPLGFEERVNGYGLVVKGWVPQLKILAHESVGGFLTHSGWSSCIEGVSIGQPLAMLPVFGDQRLNSQVMEEMGIGYTVERNEEDGGFSKEEVAKVVRLVMVEEEGERCREKAREMGKVFGSQELQEKCMDEFVKYLQDHRGDGNNYSSSSK